MRNIALVTGASSGMGKEFVREISKKYKGLDEIWVVARRRERLRELKKKSLNKSEDSSIRSYEGRKL